MTLFVYLLLLQFSKAKEAMEGRDNIKINDINVTEMEFQAYFGELPENQDYEVSYLTPVNGRGEEVSRKRVIRDTPDEKQKFYNISVLGFTLHLNLILNVHLLAPSFHIETKHSNGSITKSPPAHRNFYHGHVTSYQGSKVALGGKYKLRGTIVISDDHLFEIHPLPDHLLKDSKKENLPHLVIKRSLAKPSFFDDDFNGLNETFIEKRRTNKRQLGGQTHYKTKFLEVIYVADEYAKDLYGSIDLPEMLLSIGNIVSQLIYGISYSDPNVVYTINRICLVNNVTLSYAKDASKLRKLHEITKWASVNNVADNNNTNQADQTVLFTTNNNGGMATQGVLCRRRDASAIVSLRGLSSSFVTAHEIGHSLGYGHDGYRQNENCPNNVNIMSTYTTSGPTAFEWSNCTKEYAANFLRSDRSRCLDNLSALRGPTQSPFLRAKLPGEVFNADQQCEMIFGSGRKQCPIKRNTCSLLYCTKSSSLCSYILSPPADGTRCGERDWCIHGECVDDGSPMINGNWGEWSAYAPCTRSCGGGVQHRTRQCDNPSPANGGMKCVGSSVSRHILCNQKPCPKEQPSYRHLQCQEAGYSKAYYIPKQACSLWCLRNWGIFYRGRVRDGTPCTDNPNDNDVCIGGRCQTFGCDSIFNSEKENDRCGICDGGGNTCAKRVMYYKRKLKWVFGTSNPFSVIVLKKGFSNITVKETLATWNWIGVQNMNGEYLIRLPTYSKTVYKAGTKISYIQKSFVFKDEIIMPGPIQEELRIVYVRNYEGHQDVKISFFEQIDNPEKLSPHSFTWKEYRWSECSQNCGGGFKKRKVKCLRRDDMTIAGNRFCDATSKPDEKEYCYTPCFAEWLVTDWKPCSKTCGGGTQTREIICRRKKMNSWIIEDDSACVKPRPVETVFERRCNEILCPPEYVPQDWSQCSTSCEEGLSTRKLECHIINEKGISEFVSVGVCQRSGSPEPQTKRRCNHDRPCQDKALNYAFKGCFRDSRELRLLPVMLENLRSKIDWRDPSATIDECAIIASKKRKKFFAIQYYGECRSYTDENRDYTELGPSHNHWAGLGGSWTNCVYKFL